MLSLVVLLDVNLFARTLILFCFVFSHHLPGQQYSKKIDFDSPSEAIKFLVNSGQYRLALETASESLSKLQNPCAYEDIFPWSTIAARALNDTNAENFLVRAALECNPSRQMFWEEAYNLWNKSSDFKEDDFFENASRNLSKESYSNLWFSVKNKSLNRFKNRFITNLKPTYSSNYNNGLTVDTIEIFGLPFKTSQDSKKLNGLGVELNVLNQLRVFDSPYQSLRLNLGLSLTDYPSFKGDGILMQNEISLRDISSSHPLLVRYIYNKREFANKPQLSSNRLIFKSTGYKNKYIESFDVILRKNKYYVSSFQDGKGIEVSLKLNQERLNIVPSFNSYKAQQQTFSYFGSGIFISDKRNKLNFFYSHNKYRDKSYAFGKTRSDKVYGVSLRFNAGYFFQQNIVASLDLIKSDSNIGVYESDQIGLSLDLMR